MTTEYLFKSSYFTLRNASTANDCTRGKKPAILGYCGRNPGIAGSIAPEFRALVRTRYKTSLKQRPGRPAKIEMFRCLNFFD